MTGTTSRFFPIKGNDSMKMSEEPLKNALERSVIRSNFPGHHQSDSIFHKPHNQS
jgi:hypothetical protein